MSTTLPPTRGLVFPEFLILVVALRFCEAGYESIIGAEIPKFTGPILNVTIPLGREAVLECNIDNLAAYKVAWLRVDTQTILTIHSHVITKNHRIAVTHTEHRNWYLHIRDVRESDMGWYMCQINTDPMKSQIGFLNVVVPPDILDFPTSADMVVRESQNVSLQCAATGSPSPTISWRREGGELINLGTGQESTTFEGPMLNITKIGRLHMGAYLCIASNGVPPSVSKRIMLIVHFPPVISVQHQLIAERENSQTVLECVSEAYPKSINYWTKGSGQIISPGNKYEPKLVEDSYKVHMKLTIKNITSEDFGSYKCVAKNSLGETDGSIKLYPKPTPTTVKPTTQKVTRASTTKSTSAPKQHTQKQEEAILDVSANEIKTQEIVKEKDAKLTSDSADGKLSELSNSENGMIFSSSTSINLSFDLSLGVKIIWLIGAIISFY